MNKKDIPKLPRTNFALIKAREFIQKANIRKLPINPKILYEEFKWELYSCSEIEELYNKKDPFKIHKYNVDAKTIYDIKNNVYISIYDEKVLEERIRWTLTHEIGHIVLGHLKDFKEVLHRRRLTKKKYDTLEREADIFAAEVLAPMGILKAINALTSDKIAEICYLSKQASINRESEIKWHGNKKMYYESDSVLYNHFREYILKMIGLKNNLNSNNISCEKIIKHSKNNIVDLNSIRCCPNCGVNIISYTTQYCKKCGTKLNEKGKVKNYMTYTDGYEVDDNGKMIKCGKCGNTEMIVNGKFCRICGTLLINECTHCGEPAAGNARYCESCGETTSFFETGLLNDWETAQQNITQQEIASSKNGSNRETNSFDDNEIPF